MNNEEAQFSSGFRIRLTRKLNSHHHAHVQHYHKRHKERNHSGRLRNHVNRIDNGVKQAKSENHAKQIDGNIGQRIGQHVQEHYQNDGYNILQIIHVGPTNTFDFFRDAHFGFVKSSIFRIGKGLVKRATKREGEFIILFNI